MGIRFAKLEGMYYNILSENEKKKENIDPNKDTIIIHCGDVPLVINKKIFIKKN